MNIYTILILGGVLLFAVVIIYVRARNQAKDSPADIARTEAAAERARDATDAETDD